MQKFLMALLVLCTAATCLAARKPGEKLKVATTIDFLDYAFFDNPDQGEYFTIEAYEERIRQMAEGGINKIYLRVNACGVPNYPTMVSIRYGSNESRLHWGSINAARRFARTLDAYDNLAETIRLGHKYGMEVWAWDSLNDDGGVRDVDTVPQSPEQKAAMEAVDRCPLMEPAYFTHPGWQAMRNPRLQKTQAEVDAINAVARRLPVAKIVIRDSGNVNKDAAGQPYNSLRIKQEEVELYTSKDNETFTRYDGVVNMRGYRDADGVLCCEFSGFELEGPYFKLAHPTYDDERWSIAVRKRTGDCKVFNTAGEELVHLWANISSPDASKEHTGLNFTRFISSGYDYRHYQLGFVVGSIAAPTAPQYYGGFTEFAVDDARAFRLRKFAEIAKYPFDGFMINFRSHSTQNLRPGGDSDEFGFNPEVRQKTIERCGKDPADAPSAVPVMNMIRAEAIADYFRGCKELIGSRPLFISGLPNKKPNGYSNIYGQLPWLYSRYFKDGSIDGVMMLGSDFRDELTPDVLQGRKITLGFFREMAYPPKGYDFIKDIAALKEDLEIDEVELYETLVLTNEPWRFDEIKK